MATVLMIGATSAVAQAVSQRMVARGDRLFCVARNEAKLAQVAEALGAGCVGTLSFDFNEKARVAEAVASAETALGQIDIAFIAHGVLPDQIASEHDLTLARDTFETNLLSAIAFLIPLSECMEAQGHGKIGVITSVAGDRGRPRNYTYGAAKGALTLYLQGLRSRLWGSGVEIYTFKMGPVDTPMTVDHAKNASFSTTDAVAERMVKALNGRRYELYVPGFWRWVMAAVRWMPEWLFQRIGFLSGR